MLRNYFLINLLLVLVIVLLGVDLHKILMTSYVIPTKPTIVSPERAIRKPASKVAHANSVSYDVIASRNLFHPSRAINSKPVTASRPVSKNELPQLFGTIIMEDRKFAILEDQSAKKSNLYKVNDAVSGFVVFRILENKVVLQRGGESIEVNLRADKNFKQPGRTQARRRAVRKASQQRKRPRRARSPSRIRRSRPNP